MAYLDLIIIAYLIITPIIGLSRGASTELSSLIKLTITIIAIFLLSSLLVDIFAIPLINKPYLLLSLCVSSYVLIAFFGNIILIPLNLLLQTVIPNLLSKLLGFSLATIKAFLLVAAFIIFILKFSESASPSWLTDSKTAEIIHSNKTTATTFISYYDKITENIFKISTDNKKSEQQDSTKEKLQEKKNYLIDNIDEAKKLIKFYQILNQDEEVDPDLNHKLDADNSETEQLEDELDLDSLIDRLE
ncbi:MAG: CvpA family protein [Rickettsiales bacterium]